MPEIRQQGLNFAFLMQFELQLLLTSQFSSSPPPHKSRCLLVLLIHSVCLLRLCTMSALDFILERVFVRERLYLAIYKELYYYNNNIMMAMMRMMCNARIWQGNIVGGAVVRKRKKDLICNVSYIRSSVVFRYHETVCFHLRLAKPLLLHIYYYFWIFVFIFSV